MFHSMLMFATFAIAIKVTLATNNDTGFLLLILSYVLLAFWNLVRLITEEHAFTLGMLAILVFRIPGMYRRQRDVGIMETPENMRNDSSSMSANDGKGEYAKKDVEGLVIDNSTKGLREKERLSELEGIFDEIPGMGGTMGRMPEEMSWTKRMELLESYNKKLRAVDSESLL